ncbi:MAG: phosphatidate cytidylyltransferase [Chloroflexota bacterium]
MASLGQRTPTAIIYGLVVLGALAAPGPAFTALVAALLVIGLIELAALARRLGSTSLTLAAFAAGAALLVLGVASLLLLTSYAQTHDLVERPWVLVALVPTWVGDTTAYLVGSLIGRRRLAPRISPGKTWEGTLAGFLGAALATVAVIAAAFSVPPSALVVALIALAIGPVGLLGDLA